jgi:hypothetical protein
MDEAIREYKRRLDRTMILRSLRMSVEERIQRLEQMAILREELRQGRKKARKESSGGR